MNLSNYYTDICKFPILTSEEEKVLISTYFDESASERARNRAKEALISSNLRFVFKQSKRLSGGDQDQFIELISAGNEGLVAGLDKFDPQSDMRFLTYVGWWVFQRQMKQMSEFRLVSLPTQKQQLSVKIKRFKDRLGREPSMKELKIEFPDSPLKDLKELSQTAFLTFYLGNVHEDDIPTVEGMRSLEKELIIKDLYETIEDHYGEDAELIKKLHGLTDNGKKMSYSQIMSEHDNVSRAYLKDLKQKSLKVLQSQLT